MKSFYGSVGQLLATLFIACAPLWARAQYNPATDYVLASQAQVNAFKTDSIKGRRLIISGADIKNINALKNLITVSNLIIENNPLLVNLNPLNSLQRVEKELQIVNNSAIKAINGFAMLDSVGSLTISGNKVLRTINGFAGLTSGAELTISIKENPALLRIDGFNTVNRVKAISIVNNPLLTAITGFKNLQSITLVRRYAEGGLYLNGNSRLADISGFTAVIHIDHLDLSNTRLRNVDAFKSWLTTGGGSINIYANPLLTNLDGLSNLTHFDVTAGITFAANLTNNPRLTNPCGITTLLLGGSGNPETLYGRVFVSGSGFHLYDLIACGETRLVIPPEPVVHLAFNEASGNPRNSGSLPINFEKSTVKPVITTNVPADAGGQYALDFGATPGNYYVESTETIEQLKNLSSFTITGWLNNKSAVTGVGGNRIVTWANGGNDGVDLVYRKDGSLQLGIDEAPDASPAFSHPKKVTTNVNGKNANWTFFAVTYSADTVKFYFGNNVKDAALDVVKSYPGRGLTGSMISSLAIGHMNISSRSQATLDRMFRGAIDDIQIFNAKLDLEKILGIQHNLGTWDKTPPTAPADLRIVNTTPSSVKIAWSASTDIDLTKYVVSNGSGVQATIPPDSVSYTFNFVPENGQRYMLSVTAYDKANNFASSYIIYTPNNTGPLVKLPLNPEHGATYNGGSLSNIAFSASSGIPAPYATNPHTTPTVTNDALHFGTVENDYFIESTTIPDGLKGLGSFTLTGWINNQSTATDIGGNRIMCWVNRGGDGVDLAYYSDGSLRLGVNSWNDGSPAVSSTNKITTVSPGDANAANNWVFFAVTYRASDGRVEYYFGTDKETASLDVTRCYPGRGPIGQNIMTLAVANIPFNARYPYDYNRVLKAAVSDFQIWGSALPSSEIENIQGIVAQKQSASQARMVAAEMVLPKTDEIETALYQNYPNPFSDGTQINVSLPHSVLAARIEVHDISGRKLKSLDIQERGNTSVTISGGELGTGIYLCSLIVDGKVVGVKRMAVMK